MESFFVALEYPFMQRALIAGICLGIVCSVLSIFVVLRKMAFIGHGMSHASFGGVALALFCNMDPFIVSIVFCLGVGLFIGWLSQHRRISEDSAIGLALTMTMALGSILIALRKSYTPDIFSYLFGDILLILPQDMPWVIGVCCFVFLVVLMLFRPLYSFAFHEELAWIEGIPIRYLWLLLISLLSMVIVVAVKLVGVVLVSAFLLFPGLIACQFSSYIGRILVLSFMVSISSVVIGLFVSYYLDLPSGAVIVNCQFLIFIIAIIIHKFRTIFPLHFAGGKR